MSSDTLHDLFLAGKDAIKAIPTDSESDPLSQKVVTSNVGGPMNMVDWKYGRFLL